MKGPATGRAGRLDWQQVRARLARLERAAEDALAVSPEQARGILDQRARLLAQAPVQAARAGELREVVTFRLGKERFALALGSIRQVVPVADIVPVPGAPSHLAGVVNLRGEILAVFDLRRLQGSEGHRPATGARVLVVGTDRAELGLLADAVDEILTLRPDAILPPPSLAGLRAGGLIEGVTADALIILDGAALLADQRLVIDLSTEAM
jgi:purine-binding chemotaxis protein CheW